MFGLQEFLATTTIQAAKDLEAALLRLPADKRDWKASPASRSALNQVAECALMNYATIGMLETQQFPAESATVAFAKEIAALAQDWPALQARLHGNAAQVAEVIRGVPDAELEKPIVLPWETTTLAQVVAYPYWNMAYHLGQINFIAQMLGVPD